jgi:hypothetical protein
MTKNAGIKTAVLALLLIVLSSGAAYADGRASFRLHLKNLVTGEVITIQDGGALDIDSDVGEIRVDTNILNSYVNITVAATEPDGGTSSVLTLSSSVQHTGVGTMQIILEDVYNSTVSQGWFTGTVGGMMADVYDDSIGDMVDGIGNAQANFNVFLNLDGVPADDGELPVPAGQGAFGAAGLDVVADIPVNTSVPYGFNFTQSTYSVLSVATLNFTGGPGYVDFALRGQVAGYGDPLASERVPEPISLLLVGSGLLGLGVLRRKMRPTN